MNGGSLGVELVSVTTIPSSVTPFSPDVCTPSKVRDQTTLAPALLVSVNQALAVPPMYSTAPERR